MKKGLLPLLFLAIGNIAFAQSAKQVQWSYSAKKIADKTYEIHMTATVNGDYHIYAQHQSIAGDIGPVATTFTFTKNPLLILDKVIKESGKLIKKHEEAWKGEVNYFEKAVDFVQIVKLKANVKTNLAGKVEFEVCNERQCLPPSEVEINVNIGE
ncbi:MAG TPA: protein-disulfide reductase DsbD domain-containing protein [Puia sp.]|nr:protein-disulfide reductase DsbD domain-containing protein [Puia sp.]